ILGSIFANVAFSPVISVGEANHLLQIATALTYRQMCILSLVERKRQGLIVIQLRKEPFRGTLPFETLSILQQIFQMYSLGLLSPMGGGYWLSWFEIVPDALTTTGPGARCYQAMGLQDIPVQDLEAVAWKLQ
ncbi:MAG: hypothetical protein ACREBU_26475, partial [Nitrososphaera sp.]